MGSPLGCGPYVGDHGGLELALRPPTHDDIAHVLAVNLKAFTEEFYHGICATRRQRVLATGDEGEVTW